MDPQQRLLLEVSWEALENAGVPPDQLAGSRSGVFVGVVVTDYDKLSTGDRDIYTVTGNGHSFPAGRLAYTFDLHGPSMTVDTACSSSLVAVHLACQSLRARESGLALAGGVSLLLARDMTDMLTTSGVLSPDGRCKTFDARANGTVRGEGCGMLVLKRLSDALAAGDPVLAVIRGSAVNSDGRSSGISAPNGTAQKAMLQEALRSARLEAADIGYVETHGTGTPLGDPIEVGALAEVLGRPRADGSSCVLGAVKTNIGHLDAAAGVAGLIKAVLALQHERIPASLHLRTPNPRLALSGTSLLLSTQPVAWPRTPPHTRIAGINSFGISGTNAHVIIAEAPGTAPAEAVPLTGPVVVPISAGGPAALRRLAETYQETLTNGEAELNDIAYTAAVRRQHHRNRAAFVVNTRAELAQRLDEYATERGPAGLPSERGEAADPPRVVFVFPGQGSEWLGMGRELLAHERAFRDAIEECNAAVLQEAGWSVVEELRADPGRSRLDQVDVAQPVLFAMSVGLAALWQFWGVTPGAVIGHSLGEVAAAHVAGALSLADATRIICCRSRLLRRLRGRGTMALADLPVPDMQRLLTGRDGVSVAASNSRRSTVIAGESAAVDQLLADLASAGVFCRRLNVDVPGHSSQVEPLTGELLSELAGLAPEPAAIPLYSTVTGSATTGTDLDARYWARNLRAPVLFAGAIQPLIEDGNALFIEVGPHPILLHAIKEEHGVAFASLRRQHGERRAMLETLAALYRRGVQVSWRAIYPGGGRVVSLPNYPWQGERYWVDSRLPGRRRDSGHPLLGPPVEVAGQRGMRVWQSELSPDEPGYLADHQIDGAVVLPAAACIEMALAGLGEHWALEDVAFDRMAVLFRDRVHHVQLVVSSQEPDRAAFRLFGRTGADRNWVCYAQGRARLWAEAPPPRAETTDALRQRCPSEVDPQTLYAAYAERAMEYGPAFQGVTATWIGTGEGGGHVRLPVPAAGHLCHPALLDACFQVLGAVLLGQRPAPPGVAITPVAVRRIKIHRLPGEQVWVHVRLHPSGDDIGDVLLLDERGGVLAEVQGLRVQRVPGRQLYADWLYRLDWPRVRTPDTAPARRDGRGTDGRGTWVVLADACGVGKALAEELGQRNQACMLAEAGGMRTATEVTVGELLDRIVEGGGTCAGVVHMCSLDTAATEQTTARTLAEDEQLALSTLQTARAIVRRNWRDVPRLWLVTRGALAVGGEAGPAAVAQAPLWGLGRTLSMEHPELACARVDLDPVWEPQTAAAALLAELSADDEDEVALRASGRHAARLVRARFDAPAAEPDFTEGTYLITGGLGGLGIGLAGWLAERGASHVVLLGRSKPDPQARLALERIQRVGTTLHAVRADVTDRAELTAIFADLDRRLPPLRGVLHAAMVLDDRTIAELDAERFGKVMAPKVQGAWNLHELSRDRPLDFFVLYSSAAALLGSPGQANYAAANAFLGALARYRRSIGLPALCVDWGLYAEAGRMADRAEAGRRLASRGIGTLTPCQGMEILGRFLGGDPVHIAAVNVDFRQWLEFFPTAASASVFTDLRSGDAGQSEDRAFVELLTAASSIERPGLVEDLVCAQLGQVLQLDPGAIERSAPFTELGIDSLMALEIRNRLEPVLGVRLSAAVLFTFPTVAVLAGQLLETLGLAEHRNAHDLAGLGTDELLSLIDGSVNRAGRGM